MREAERHHSEEEILAYLLGDGAVEPREDVRRHLARCSACEAVYLELAELPSLLARWRVVELPESVWAARKRELLAELARPRPLGERWMVGALVRTLRGAWNYALENPLAALGYVAVAVAFASEQTITVFRLEHVLPATTEMIDIVRRVLWNG